MLSFIVSADIFCLKMLLFDALIINLFRLLAYPSVVKLTEAAGVIERLVSLFISYKDWS